MITYGEVNQIFHLATLSVCVCATCALYREHLSLRKVYRCGATDWMLWRDEITGSDFKKSRNLFKVIWSGAYLFIMSLSNDTDNITQLSSDNLFATKKEILACLELFNIFNWKPEIQRKHLELRRPVKLSLMAWKKQPQIKKKRWRVAFDV